MMKESTCLFGESVIDAAQKAIRELSSSTHPALVILMLNARIAKYVQNANNYDRSQKTCQQ